MAIVTIVGAGLMGTATAYPLADNGHTIRLVGTHLDGEIIASCKERNFHPKLRRNLPAGVTPFYIEELDQALDGAQVIVSGVNSHGVHWVGKTLGPRLHQNHTLIAITKGLELNQHGELAIFPDVLKSEFPPDMREQVRQAAVGGPCIAGELAGKRHSMVVFGSRDEQTAVNLAGTFRTSYYHIWTTTDLESLEFSAALKNAYTLGVALAFGLLEKAGGVDQADAHMFNLAAGLFGVATTEIEQILRMHGLNSRFAYGLPGAGDLYVTSMGGRTMRLGALIGKGHSYQEARQIMAGETLEAAEIIKVLGQAVPKLEQQGRLKPGELPFLRTLIDIVVHNRPVDLPVDTFFSSNQMLT